MIAGNPESLEGNNVPGAVRWSDVLDQNIPKEIVETKDIFNSLNYPELIHTLRAQKSRDPENGIKYAWIKSPGDSEESGIIHFGRLGNRVSDSMLLRANFLYMVFRKQGLTDDKGNSLPLLSFVLPATDSALKLKTDDYKYLEQGVLGPISVAYLNVVAKKNLGRVYIIGEQVGSTIAANMDNFAPSIGLDVTHMALAEPSNVIDRDPKTLQKQYKKVQSASAEALVSGGVKAFTDAAKLEKLLKYTYDLEPINRTHKFLWKILASNTLKYDIISANHFASAPNLVTIGYGENSETTPKDAVLSTLSEANASRANQPDLSTEAIEIANYGHEWIDNIQILAMFYANSLARKHT